SPCYFLSAGKAIQRSPFLSPLSFYYFGRTPLAIDRVSALWHYFFAARGATGRGGRSVRTPVPEPVQVPAFPNDTRPFALAGCLRFAWARVLFPGQAPPSTPLRWQNLLLVLLLPGMLLYPCLGFHLFEPDEGRYAEIPREMADRDEWVVPYLQGEPYLDKPPLFYWLVMACYRVFGVHAWSARLVPALAIHGSILLVYFFGRRPLGERSALWGALFLGLAPAFVSMGRLLVLDGLLAWWVTLSVFCAFVAVRRVRLHWA